MGLARNSVTPTTCRGGTCIGCATCVPPCHLPYPPAHKSGAASRQPGLAFCSFVHYYANGGNAFHSAFHLPHIPLFEEDRPRCALCDEPRMPNSREAPPAI